MTTVPPNQQDSGRRQTYWNAEANAYRKSRYSKMTWPVIVGILVVVLTLGILWKFYGGDSLGEIAEKTGLEVIEPTQDIVKHVPDSPGGESIPHQDKYIYNTIDGSTPVSVLGAEYQAEMIRKDPEAPYDVQQHLTLDDRARQEAGLLEEGAIGAMQQGVSYDQAASVAMANVGDRVMQGTARAVDSGEGQRLLHEGARDLDAVGKDLVDIGDTASSNPFSSSSPFSGSSVARPEPAFVSNVGADNQGQGSYTVQLAAMHSQDVAKEEWVALSAQHPDLRGQLHAICPHVVKGYGKLYKVFVGKFSSFSKARAFCSPLKQGGIDCFALEAPVDFSTCVQ